MDKLVVSDINTDMTASGTGAEQNRSPVRRLLRETAAHFLLFIG